MRFPVFLPVLGFFVGLGFAAVGAAPALADDAFTVSGLHVDATAASSSEALTLALASGRPKAFQILYRRLTRTQDWDHQPALDAAALLRLSRGYTITNERRSTTRYVADVTYIFNPDAVTRLLRGANIAFAQTQTKRILLIAMSPAVTNGPWAQAFANNAMRDGGVPYSLPAPEDVKTLAGLSFDAATWSDIAAAAGHAHATEAALVQALYANGKITVSIRRLGLSGPPTGTSLTVPLLQTLGTTYPAAAQAALAAIDDLWKSRAAIDYGARGHLTADMHIASLSQWGDVQSALSGVTLVTGVTLVAMDTGYARLSISYLGNTDQLRDALAAARLSLANRGGQWLIAQNP